MPDTHSVLGSYKDEMLWWAEVLEDQYWKKHNDCCCCLGAQWRGWFMHYVHSTLIVSDTMHIIKEPVWVLRTLLHCLSLLCPFLTKQTHLCNKNIKLILFLWQAFLPWFTLFLFVIITEHFRLSTMPSFSLWWVTAVPHSSCVSQKISAPYRIISVMVLYMQQYWISYCREHKLNFK